MNDKERLEEIKLKFNNTIDVMLYVPYEDVKFLIEQAERVQELEKQNKRYKRALEDISNADWNSEGLDAERELDKVTDVAFKALEGKE